MGRRGKNSGRPRGNTHPESVTPWWNNGDVFTPKSHRDRRADSEFFAEFSAESLFADAATLDDGPRDPYEVLGLFPGASLAQVKKAHRKLAKRYHPDRFMNTSEMERHRVEQKMVLVNAAYAELLSRITSSPN